MLGHRHQLDVREAHVASRTRRAERRSRDSVSRSVVVGPRRHEPSESRRSPSARRAHCGVARVLHPLAVLPLVVERPDARGGARRRSPRRRRTDRPCRPPTRPCAETTRYLYVCSVLDTRYEALPDAGTVRTRLHRMRGRFPSVELADDRDPRALGAHTANDAPAVSLPAPASPARWQPMPR